MNHGMKQSWLRRAPLAAALLFPLVAQAATAPAGMVLVATSGVKAVGADGTVRDLVRRAPVFAGDRLVTGSAARVQIKFTDGSIMALKPNSEMSVDRYAYEEKGAQAMFMSLVKGGFRTVTGAIGKTSRQDYRISTPVATIGVRGTLHEADFNPQTGLGLGVWDGGIQACNSGGCLDLGLDSDYRFGFIGLDGRGQGRNTPPDGVGDDGDSDGGDGVVDNETPPAGNGDQAEQTQGLFVTDADGFLYANQPPPGPRFVGAAAVGAPLGSALSYPWGGTKVLAVQDADLLLRAAENTGWWLRADAAGGYINQGFVGSSTFSSSPFTKTTDDGKGQYAWGSWSGEFSGQTSLEHDVSLGTAPDVPTGVAIPAQGLFIIGTPALPEVVNALSGELDFTLLYEPDIFSQQFPHFVDASGVVQTALSASGNLLLDVTGASISGNLDFDVDSNFDFSPDGSWHLALDGSFANRVVTLDVLDGVDGSTTNSYFLPAGASAGFELGVTGDVSATLAGSGQDLALLGSFNVSTISTSDNNYASGIFLMEHVLPPDPPDFNGFIAMAAPSASTQGLSTFFLDDVRVVTGTDAQQNPVILDLAMHSSDLNQFVLPACECSPGVLTSPSTDPFVLEMPTGSSTLRAVYGVFESNTMSLTSVDNGFFTANPITEAGAYVFGDWASPDIIDAAAQVFGTVNFSVVSPALFVDANGIQSAGASMSGSMNADITNGGASGFMSLASAQSDTWDFSFSGSIGPQQMVMGVTSGTFTDGGTGATDSVSGVVQAAFVGQTELTGVVGSFDVQTQATSDSDFARGVFVMQSTGAGGG